MSTSSCHVHHDIHTSHGIMRMDVGMISWQMSWKLTIHFIAVLASSVGVFEIHGPIHCDVQKLAQICLKSHGTYHHLFCVRNFERKSVKSHGKFTLYGRLLSPFTTKDIVLASASILCTSDCCWGVALLSLRLYQSRDSPPSIYNASPRSSPRKSGFRLKFSYSRDLLPHRK